MMLYPKKLASGEVIPYPEDVELIKRALAEDLGEQGDVTTSALVPANVQATAHLVTRKPGVIAGLGVAMDVFGWALEMAKIKPMPKVELRTHGQAHVKDSDFVEANTKLATITGTAAAILTAERTVLNFLCHLSGVATATHELQNKIKHTRAKVCDTRKTTPGLRALEKYAVLCGGGANHRMGLYDMVMIKDNHITAIGDIGAAVARTRAAQPDLPIAVEVENLDQLRAALTAGADRIMFDNMDIKTTREAVEISRNLRPQTVLESTGGVTVENIAAIAETGVDFISVGAITHSAPALDIGLDFS